MSAISNRIREALKAFSEVDPLNPYAGIVWETTEVALVHHETKQVLFNRSCTFPNFYSDMARRTVATKYFKVVDGAPESDLRQLIDRVANQLGSWVGELKIDADLVAAYTGLLKYLLVHQYCSFNSPVWFNGGRFDNPQMSACFINGVEDSMESILDLCKTEGMLFKGGSGTGTNFSTLRGSMESLNGGGISSGPMSFIKSLDRFAGAIKSGGANRRAARMVILNDDHPDIEEFIDCKVKEEAKARLLAAHGFGSGIDGDAYQTVAFQNGNNTVRCFDNFLFKVVNNEQHDLTARTDGRVVKTVPARKLWDSIAKATWECGDPGVQFDTTIQNWHTTPKAGRIEASNPCSEFLAINGSACNLATLNVKRFYADRFKLDQFVSAVHMLILAMDAIVDHASYPTEQIKNNSRQYRFLGLNYGNLGALLVSLGLAYNGPRGRAFAAALTSIMTAAAYDMSATLAEDLGAFKGYSENSSDMNRVLDMHTLYAETLAWGDYDSRFEEFPHATIPIEALKHFAEATWLPDLKNSSEIIALARYGAELWHRLKNRPMRNAQVSVMAPTGTISFFMDAETTGIEPVLAPVQYKTLVGGGVMQIISSSIQEGLTALGYDETARKNIADYAIANGHLQGCSQLKNEHADIFLTSLAPKDARTLSWQDHLDMMAAIQPFISGAISKTVNMPRSATVEEISKAYLKAWEIGLKCIAIYRNDSKGAQPLTVEKKTAANTPATNAQERRKLPRTRSAMTHHFRVGEQDGYLTVGLFEDGKPGEIFLRMAKQGTTVNGLMDAVAISTSLALQYGCPLTHLSDSHAFTRFEPAGMTGNKELPIAMSVTDYVFRWMISQFGSDDEKARFGIHTETSGEADRLVGDSVICASCGGTAYRKGTCYCCSSCATTTGCS